MLNKSTVNCYYFKQSLIYEFIPIFIPRAAVDKINLFILSTYLNFHIIHKLDNCSFFETKNIVDTVKKMKQLNDATKICWKKNMLTSIELEPRNKLTNIESSQRTSVGTLISNVPWTSVCFHEAAAYNRVKKGEPWALGTTRWLHLVQTILNDVCAPSADSENSSTAQY